MKDLKYWVAFSKILQLGPKRFRLLLSHFPNLEEAWRAPILELKKAGLEEKIVNLIEKRRKEIDPEKEMEILAKENIKVIPIKAKDYPKLLSEISSPPPLLYLKGEILSRDEFAIAIVGSRKPTQYGIQVTLEIAKDLALAGLTIISGLALGIDTIAHKMALEANGRTIGVLGGGIDWNSIYPKENKYLIEQILEKGGAILSEFPIGTPPLKQNFPFRNRIIAGLSLGTLVIEATETSGALLTARHAIENSREVFAIPGSIYSKSSVGPNNLIKMGGKLVTSAQDILEEFNLGSVKKIIKAREIHPDTKEEKKLLEFISENPINIDELIKKSGLAPSVVNSTLILMEMKGKVRNLGGGNYVIGK